MDFDGIINWFTETLPAMLLQWFDTFVAFAIPLWDKTVDFVSTWFSFTVTFFKQAWENLPALMADWGVAISEFLKSLRKSFSELLPESVLPVLDPIPDWALFIVAPLVILLLLVLILKKIFGGPKESEKHLKSVESPEVPTFRQPMPADENDFVDQQGNADDEDVPEIPEPGRPDPAVSMEAVEPADIDPIERQEPQLVQEPREDEVSLDAAEKLETPTSIGPGELQTRIREQLGIDESTEEPSDRVEPASDDAEAGNLLDTNAERDISLSLGKLRGLRPESEARSAELNITGISDDKTEEEDPPPDPVEVELKPDPSPEPLEPTLAVPSASSPEEPRIILTPVSASEEPREAAGSSVENTPPSEPGQPTDVPLAAMAPEAVPETPPVAAADVVDPPETKKIDDEEPTVGETEPRPDEQTAGSDSEGDQTESTTVTGVPAPPGPLLATLARLEEGLRVNERLAAQNPASAQVQRDVAISMSRLADALVEAGDLANAIPRFQQSLAISERLAEQNPASAEALRDVTVSLNRLGDALTITGDLEGATAQYEMSLRVSQQIAEQSPANAQAQRDVWISLNRLGDVRSKAGNLDGAIAHFETGMQISKRLADFNPANIEAQRDLIVSYAKLGEICPGQGWWTRGLEVCEQLAAQGKLQSQDSWMLEDLRRRSAADAS
ncbi:MAG: hypothetical protein GKS01_10830 [Alphaproteobacteria bacterium]|nr:hypothetical protein [Alphaproteobacteria bacterium]